MQVNKEIDTEQKRIEDEKKKKVQRTNLKTNIHKLAKISHVMSLTRLNFDIAPVRSPLVRRNDGNDDKGTFKIYIYHT